MGFLIVNPHRQLQIQAKPLTTQAETGTNN